MKKLFLLAAVAAMFLSSCTRTPQGWKGIKTHEFGSKKGEVEILGPGLYAVSWIGKFHIYLYPANVQLCSFDTVNNSRGEMIADNRLQFQAEGQTLTAAIGIEYEFNTDEEAMRSMYVYFKRSPREIERENMRKDIVSAFNKVTQDLTVEEVYSTKKDSVRLAVQEIMRAKYAQHGIIINEVTYLSPVDPPKIVMMPSTLRLPQRKRLKREKTRSLQRKPKHKRK